MQVDYKVKYFDLYQLFGGYLNQSWKSIYVWESNQPNYQSVIRKYKTEESPEGIEKTIIQLKDILIFGNSLSEEEWMNILTWGLSLGYYPPGVGIDYKTWLEEILSILQEPANETVKHFTPKRIGE